MSTRKTVEHDMLQQIRDKWLRAVHAVDPIIQNDIGWTGRNNCCSCEVHDSDFWVQVLADNTKEKVAEIAVKFLFQDDSDTDPAIKLVFQLPKIGKQTEMESFELLFSTIGVTVQDAADRAVRGMVRFCELVYWDMRAQDSRMAYLEANIPDYGALFPPVGP